MFPRLRKRGALNSLYKGKSGFKNCKCFQLFSLKKDRASNMNQLGTNCSHKIMGWEVNGLVIQYFTWAFSFAED